MDPANDTDKPVDDDKGGEIALAALVVGVVACVGVVVLSIIVFSLMARLRRYRNRWGALNAITLMEKDPIPQSYVNTSYSADAADPAPDTVRQGSVSVGVGTLRQVTLSLLQDLLLNLYNVNVKRADHAPDNSLAPTRKDSDLHVTPAGANEVQRQLKNGLVKIFPRDQSKVDTFLSVGQAIMAATSVRQLLDSALRAMRLCLGQLREWEVLQEDYAGVVPTEGQGHVSVVVEDEVNSLMLTWDSHKLSSELLSTVTRLCQALRDERRQPTPEEYLAMQLAYYALGKPTPEEYLAMQLAYYALGKGQTISDLTHRPLGSPGFHPHTQTQLALTDSGYGHVLGTARRSDWLQGVVVHVQYIGGLGDADLVPSLFDLGKVRLHVGHSSPTTFFVSRRLGHVTNAGENMTSEMWEAELSNLVYLTANSISSAFYNGAAACHVSMAGLTTSQAATFMAQLRPHVQRERHLQALSALWDLGTPLTDDYGVEEGKGEGVGSSSPVTQGTKKVLEEPHHIARRAIDITLAGGFDQVTWYSSCDETQDPACSNNQSEQTTCVLRRLTSQQILTLVHQAHSRGLLTYFTGGVTCQDIQPAVYGGVDGVGVGGVGMLHHAKTGRNASERHGPYMEENIPKLLTCRDEAAHSLLGKAVHLLSRLDTMFFEGSLASTENALRAQLYNAIIDKKNDIITSVLSKFEDVVQMPSEAGNPITGMAGRLIARKNPALKDVAESAYEWAMFTTRLKMLLGRGDERAVGEEYGGEPWHTYRRKYREHREGPHGFFRQVSFQIELKTDF
ncbi:hypothetical protein ACOMHN_040297 [Nucella lapillus]